MHILKGGQTIAIGDAEYAESSFALTVGQWLTLMLFIAAAVPLILVFWHDPEALNDPFAVVEFSFMSLGLLAVLMLAKTTFGLLTRSGDMIAAIFDRMTGTLDVVFLGIFGMTRATIPFEEVQAIRVSRGEWSGSCVSEVVVVELATGKTFVLPETLTTRELNMLRVMTGLRRT